MQESTRKSMVFPVSAGSVVCEPTRNTITQENSSTTMVRMAVATSESVLRMPHFARMEVTPAKNAEANAYAIHIQIHLTFLTQS